ncbi:hypothetical protein F0U59_18640 [Archangium gephyra]|nr:hypothetical protein F0U59_18640 [Archangium gephyra]
MLTGRAKSRHHLSPPAYEQLSQLYELLSRNLRPTYREGPALSSLEALCDLYLQLWPERSSRASIKIAHARGLDLFLGFYYPEVDTDVDRLAVEILRYTPLSDYGLRQERMDLSGAAQLLRLTPEELDYRFAYFRA